MNLTMPSRPQRITGWVLSGLVFAFLIAASAVPKLTGQVPADMLEHLGFTADVMKGIGILEAIVAVLYIIPRTGFLGSILLTGYLGGATCAHVRVGDPFFFPPLLGVIAWVGYALRHPTVFRLLLGNTK